MNINKDLILPDDTLNTNKIDHKSNVNQIDYDSSRKDSTEIDRQSYPKTNRDQHSIQTNQQNVKIDNSKFM